MVHAQLNFVAGVWSSGLGYIICEVELLEGCQMMAGPGWLRTGCGTECVGGGSAEVEGGVEVVIPEFNWDKAAHVRMGRGVDGVVV